jgi:TetR/AcrR family transcriptional repressor of nem operon
MIEDAQLDFQRRSLRQQRKTQQQRQDNLTHGSSPFKVGNKYLIAALQKVLDLFKTTGHITVMAKANVKEQIVTTSLQLLHGKGFNATSVQDITEAAGVPKGSFYNHFSSKEALGLEVLQRYTDGVGQLAAVLQDRTLAPKQRLQQYFSTMIASNAANAFNFGCMLGNFSTELSNQIPAMRSAMREAHSGSAALLAAVIAEGQQDGSINTDAPADELAGFVHDAWQGAVLHAKAEQSSEPLERFVRVALGRMLT